MTIEEIRKVLEAETLVAAPGARKEATAAIASDMLSDVLTFASPGSLLLTGCNNPQAVRTAELADLAAVCYVQGKAPGPESMALARQKRIVLLATPLSLYVACSRLAAAGLPASRQNP